MIYLFILYLNLFYMLGNPSSRSKKYDESEYAKVNQGQ